MGTEVLRPQDPMAAAVDRFHATPSFHRRRHPPRISPNSIVDRRPYNGHRKTPSSPPPKRRHVRRDGRSRKTPPPSSSSLHVTILRRGESLDSLAKRGLSNDDNNGFENKSSDASGDCEDLPKSEPRGYESCDDVAICGTRRIGPESPEMIPRQIKLFTASRDVYAGSAFHLSPSPRSLPLPSFFGGGNNCHNKAESCRHDGGGVLFEDTATIGLRRLLRLDR